MILWAGLILGVSFIATPAKFMAPHLSLPLALEVGKVTFHVFDKIQWGIYVILLILTFFNKNKKSWWIFISSLFVLLGVKTFGLLPALDMRVEEILSGEEIAPSPLHSLYIGVDILEIILLLTGAWWVMNDFFNWGSKSSCGPAETKRS